MSLDGVAAACPGHDDGLSWKVGGRGARIRTGDPLLPKQVRYQAALRPDLREERSILETWAA